MTTKEEIKDALLEKMADPSLPGAMFDEYDRRVKLLNEE